MNKPMKFSVILEPRVDGGYTAYVPDLPGCVSEGKTVSEAMAMIKDAIGGYVAVINEKDWKLSKVFRRQVTVA